MPAETPVTIQNGTGAPRATLLCRPNSHPFNDRTLVLDQEIKIGRSVARAKPTVHNAIFDCKVLSRNHAVLWYSLGKFYLQDTKSSNGTFVNNQRLSKGAEESAPREVCSGDILQFGVDVMENSRKVTHGCIIATLKLFLPDGKEAKASPSIVNSTAGSCIPAQDLYQLNTFIQESLAREQLLENKLIALQKIIYETEMSSKNGWRALMEEDRLLTRVEILENQLSTYSKNMSEDKLREEAKRLMEDKEKYQNAAKDNLKKLVDEKLEAVVKLTEVETSLHHLEEEFTSVRSMYNNVLEENGKLSEKISMLTDELKKRRKEDELEDLETENKKDLLIENAISDILQNGDSMNGEMEDKEKSLDSTDVELDLTNTSGSNLNNSSGSNMNNSGSMMNSTDSLDGSKPEDELAELNSVNVDDLEVNRLRCLVEELVRVREKHENELTSLKEALHEAQNDSSTILQELNNTKNKLDNAEKLIETQDSLVREMEKRVQENSNSEMESDPESEGYGTLKKPKGTLDEGSKGAQLQFKELNLKISELEEENNVLKEKLREAANVRTTKLQVPLPVLPDSAECFDILGVNRIESLVPVSSSIPSETTDIDTALSDTKQGATVSETKEGSAERAVHNVLEHLLNEVGSQDQLGSLKEMLNDSCKEEELLNDLSKEFKEEEVLSDSKETVESVLNLSCSSCSDLSTVELALSEAEEKIAKLLQVKERLVMVEAEKNELERSVSELQEEVQVISVTSRYLTLCNILTVLVIVVAVAVAFLPSLSYLLGTQDPA